LKLDLVVAHVDHGIASESSRVAEQVMALAARYRRPGHTRSLDLGKEATETRARQERYRVLRAMQAEVAAAYLVTAHHADDQIETTLFRYLRGSAPAGLAGIPATGPRGLVRPLLPFRRAELREWLAARYPAPASGPPLFQDPANLDPRHDRSWLRQEVLPLLRQRFGSILDQNLLSGQRHAERDREAWMALLRHLPGLDFRVRGGIVDVARGLLGTYDKALSEALLRALALEAGCVLGPRRAKELAALVQSGTSGRVLELGDGWRAELVFDRLRFLRLSPAETLQPIEWGASEQGSVEWAGWEIAWRPEHAGTSIRGGLTTWMHHGRGEVRGAQDGDRVFPLGGVGRRSVHRLLMEARVPRSERAMYPVVTQGAELLWIPGVCRTSTALPVRGAPALRVDARHA
jgi:tRNA(Ile)-lysidine synthase